MEPDEIIDERYRLERLLGTGGMSEVWLCEDLRLGRWVAVKLLRGDDAAGEFADSLEREARVIAALQHPNIVQVYDAGRDRGRPYLVMEYVHGMSLRELLGYRGRMSEVEAATYGAQVATALHYAHGKGIVHCDIKPENVLVTEDGVAKAVDFGIAETAAQTLGPDEARAVLGTIAYLAPEVLQGANPDPASDVYALGLVLYEMVAGRLPFGGATPAAAAGQRLSMPAPSLRTFVPGASPALSAALEKALRIEPRERFADAAAFAASLRQVAAGGGIVTRPPRSSRPAPRALPPGGVVRHRTERLPRRGRSEAANALIGLSIAGGIALVAGGIAAAVLLSRGGDDEGPPTPTPAPSLTAVTTTSTATPTRVATSTPVPSATATPTASATPTAVTPTTTPTATRTPTGGPSPTATRTPTPQATTTATPQPTATPTQ